MWLPWTPLCTLRSRPGDLIDSLFLGWKRDSRCLDSRRRLTRSHRILSGSSDEEFKDTWSQVARWFRHRIVGVLKCWRRSSSVRCWPRITLCFEEWGIGWYLGIHKAHGAQSRPKIPRRVTMRRWWRMDHNLLKRRRVKIMPSSMQWRCDREIICLFYIPKWIWRTMQKVSTITEHVLCESARMLM